ncbi:MAG: peptide chain release factor N(5)-glutamine methyltransferase [Hyphomonas sp.]|uniref:peptide chain release factor N(5)-glutamine methyltransferase n=1 Tax=Hyphomonas sp. TaxID=87 RepID=UPI00352978E4
MTNASGLPTYADAVRAGAQRLRAAGIDGAAQEARLLVLGATGLSAAAYIAIERDPMPAEDAERFEAMLAERCARRPLQHILGTTSFYGLEFLCDGRALVPRPDSECVVEAALHLLPAGVPLRVADLGTGSGCLLAALLAHRPMARGEGVEASPAAASLARENFARLGLSGRASLFEGSWTEWDGWPSADLVMSNPPYIAAAEIATLAPEVRAHDPLSALDGGADGLDAYREIVSLAARHMKPGAWLVFEIGHDQDAAVRKLMSGAGYTMIGAAQDLGRNDRVVWGRRPAG